MKYSDPTSESEGQTDRKQSKHFKHNMLRSTLSKQPYGKLMTAFIKIYVLQIFRNLDIFIYTINTCTVIYKMRFKNFDMHSVYFAMLTFDSKPHLRSKYIENSAYFDVDVGVVSINEAVFVYQFDLLIAKNKPS